MEAVKTVKAQITDFLAKCEDVRNCKFIMATTRIKDLLKSIVNSSELYELFNTVAANFDYNAAKQQAFVDVDSTFYGNSRVILPETVGDRLAFIFCLLVEIDRNDVNLNVFLQKYYPKDGSYYASYHLFCDEVIGSLENIIADIYSQELATIDPLEIENAEKAELIPETVGRVPEMSESLPQTDEDKKAISTEVSVLLNAVSILIVSERDNIEASVLEEDEKVAGCLILNSLLDAVKNGDVTLIQALTFGYNYFALQNSFISQTFNDMFVAIGNYIDAL